MCFNGIRNVFSHREPRSRTCFISYAYDAALHKQVPYKAAIANCNQT